MTVTSILMNKHSLLVTVRPSARVESVIELMRKNDVGSVVVVSDEGRLEGLIVERDILRAIDSRNSVPPSLQAKDIMSSRVLTCSLDDSEATLMERMIKGSVEYLPVVDRGGVIAIVSMSDLVEARIRKIEDLMRDIESTVHIERHFEYFTRHLKPLKALKSSPEYGQSLA